MPLIVPELRCYGEGARGQFFQESAMEFGPHGMEVAIDRGICTDNHTSESMYERTPDTEREER